MESPKPLEYFSQHSNIKKVELKARKISIFKDGGSKKCETF